MFVKFYIVLTIMIITLAIINATQEQNQTQYKSEIRRIFVAKGERQNTPECGWP